MFQTCVVRRNSFTSLVDVTAAQFFKIDLSLNAESLILHLAYNKWHETELERWLSDHHVPYPSPADRKDLENLVKSNWNSKVATPYNDWEVPQLQNYLKARGSQVQKNSEKNKDSLVKQVQNSWTESADAASRAYGSMKDWVFDGYAYCAMIGPFH